MPLCKIPFSWGVDEPVNIICPFSDLESTNPLVASQSEGTSCHSSINLGVSPSSTLYGSISANKRLEKLPVGSPTKYSLFEWNEEVHVLPHHFGPSIQIAPKIFRYLSIKESAILFLYLVSFAILVVNVLVSYFISVKIITANWPTFVVSTDQYFDYKLTNFFSLNWPIFSVQINMRNFRITF